MTAAEWDSCISPEDMVRFLRDAGRASERKLRLLAAASCRRVWRWLADDRSRRAVEVCEDYADGRVGQKMLDAARRAAFDASKSPAPAGPGRSHGVACGTAALMALQASTSRKKVDVWLCLAGCASNAGGVAYHATGEAALWAERKAVCEVIRDIFGNPFRQPPPLPASILAWNEGMVVRLAQTAYEERLLPQGTLDPSRLAVVADALEEAGLDDQEMLLHLREQGREHYRGCWCVDAVLGKG
jgi:hypothetical protein